MLTWSGSCPISGKRYAAHLRLFLVLFLQLLCSQQPELRLQQYKVLRMSLRDLRMAVVARERAGEFGSANPCNERRGERIHPEKVKTGRKTGEKCSAYCRPRQCLMHPTLTRRHACDAGAKDCTK